MIFGTKLIKPPILSVLSFISALVIFVVAPHLCLADKSPETIIDSIPWTTIEPIPKSTPKSAPEPVSKPAPKSAPEPESLPPPGPSPTPAQLGSCFGGCNPLDDNCKMRCFQGWQKAGGR